MALNLTNPIPQITNDRDRRSSFDPVTWMYNEPGYVYDQPGLPYERFGGNVGVGPSFIELNTIKPLLIQKTVKP